MLTGKGVDTCPIVPTTLFRGHALSALLRLFSVTPMLQRRLCDTAGRNAYKADFPVLIAAVSELSALYTSIPSTLVSMAHAVILHRAWCTRASLSSPLALPQLTSC